MAITISKINEDTAKYFNGRKSATIVEVLKMDIPLEDQIYLATRDGALTQKQMKAWLEISITRAIKETVIGCGEEIIERWGREWLSGEDRSPQAADAISYIIGENEEWTDSLSDEACVSSAAESAALAEISKEAGLNREYYFWEAIEACGVGMRDRSIQLSDLRKVLKLKS